MKTLSSFDQAQHEFRKLMRWLRYWLDQLNMGNQQLNGLLGFQFAVADYHRNRTCCRPGRISCCHLLSTETKYCRHFDSYHLELARSSFQWMYLFQCQLISTVGLMMAGSFDWQWSMVTIGTMALMVARKKTSFSLSEKADTVLK